MKSLQIDTIANRLTLLRMFAVPFVVYFLSRETFSANVIAVVIFSLAALTDLLDGHIARQDKTVTIFGKLMDPLADKFLVVVTLIQLQALGRIEAILVMILVCREMAVSSLRAIAGSEGLVIAAEAGGKIKVTTQMIGIPFLMLYVDFWGISSYLIGIILLYLSVSLSLISLSKYAIDFFKVLQKKYQSRRKRFRKRKGFRRRRKSLD